MWQNTFDGYNYHHSAKDGLLCGCYKVWEFLSNLALFRKYILGINKTEPHFST